MAVHRSRCPGLNFQGSWDLALHDITDVSALEVLHNDISCLDLIHFHFSSMESVATMKL